MSSGDDQRRRRSSRPLWLVEGLDIVEERRGPFLGVVLVVVLVPTILAFVAPGIVPPTPLVGAAVGLAALLLGLAGALAIDTTDLIVRGPRHVGAAGGELVAILPSSVNTGAARRLAASMLEAREPGTQMLLGIAGAGRESAETAAWTEAVAVELARTGGVSVLRIDLASGRTERPGLAEVVKGEIKLTAAVEFEPGLKLAHLGTGDDPIRALRALPSLPGRLPSDLDVLLVALPSATNREVVNATRALDHMLVMAHRDSTSRVQLIAALDALEATGTTPQVVLVDDRTLRRLGPDAFGGPETAEAAQETGGQDADEPAAEVPAGAEHHDDLTGPPQPVAGEPTTEEAPVDDVAVPDEDGEDDGDDAEDADVPKPEPLVRPTHVGGITGVAGGVVAAAQFGRLPTAHDEAPAPSDPADEEPREPAASGATADVPVEDPAAQDDALPEWSRPWESDAPVTAPGEGVPHDAEAPGEGVAHDVEATVAATDEPTDEPADEPELDLPPPDAATRVDDAAPSGDAPHQPPPAASEPRGVDVLLGAAEASALAIAETRAVAPAEPPVTDAPTVDDRAATDPPPASAAPPAADLAPAAMDQAPPELVDDGSDDGGATSTPGTGARAAPGEDDSTDELPAVRRPEPVRSAESDEDELLRTTAQLAVLLDDLDVRSRDDGPAAP